MRGAIHNAHLAGMALRHALNSVEIFFKALADGKKFREEIIVFAEPDAVVFRFEKHCSARLFRSIHPSRKMNWSLVYSVYLAIQGSSLERTPARVSLGGCISFRFSNSENSRLGQSASRMEKQNKKARKKQNDGELFQLLP